MNFSSVHDIPQHLRRLNPELFAPQPSKPVQGAVPAREVDLHNEIIEACRRNGWLYFHGSTACSTARTLGEPDFHILLPGGRILHVECKTATGKLSIEQLGVMKQAEVLGHKIHVVRSIDEFNQLTKG